MKQTQLKRTRPRERTCMHPGGCGWRIGQHEVLCHIHIVKIPAELAKRLTAVYRDACIRYGFGRTNEFDELWSQAKKILEGRR